MPKGYIHHPRRSEEPRTLRTDFWFTSDPENAAVWETRDEADIDCRFYNSGAIEIPSALGGLHICKNFTVEERKSRGYVIFCRAPFVSTKPSIHRDLTMRITSLRKVHTSDFIWIVVESQVHGKV